MRYKKTKIFIIIMVVILILSNLSCVFADNLDTLFDKNGSMSQVASGASDLDVNSGIGKVINIIIGILQLAGTGISVIMIAMLGIKYLLASVEEKAEIKKTAMPILIGAILLFGAVNIMAIIENFAKDTLNK